MDSLQQPTATTSRELRRIDRTPHRRSAIVFPKMIAVVIPCYKVKEQILGVLQGIGPECQSIYVVDDCCPEESGTLVQDQCTDGRVKVIFHDKNRGVGGATLSGYSAALEDGAEVIVKLDGDGQMDPGFIPKLVAPVQSGEADYAKGNRFYDLD
ncbi:MAG: glycosyltransferase family 2 protein, partial [Thermoanaerobaculia bacterium]